MSLKKRATKSIALALISVNVLTPLIGTTYAMEKYSHPNSLEGISYEMEQDLSEEVSKKNLTLDEYNELLASGKIELSDSIYYNNNDYYNNAVVNGNEKKVGVLLRLATKALKLPWVKNATSTFMKFINSSYGSGIATGITLNQLDSIAVNGLPSFKKSTLVGYGHYTSGYRVTTLQRYLNEYGYNLTVDGKFGPNTEKALKSFQRSRGLEADGIAGPNTWLSLVQTRSYS